MDRGCFSLKECPVSFCEYFAEMMGWDPGELVSNFGHDGGNAWKG